jgi:hypothetical protein
MVEVKAMPQKGASEIFSNPYIISAQCINEVITTVLSLPLRQIITWKAAKKGNIINNADTKDLAK